jgi:hypothetical protein
MNIKVAEENRLIGLLAEFDKTLALSYLSKIKDVSQEIKDKGFWNVLQSIQNEVLVNPIAFRIGFVEPAFVMLSHPICRMKRKVPYPKQIEWERFFFTQLGMIPVYLVNLNVITVLKLWGDDASLADSKEVQAQLDKGELLLELSPASKPAQYSSMNFVLRNGAVINKASDELLEPFDKHYKYLFWTFPGRGYTPSSHFLHRATKITSFIKVTKSLYRITAIGNPRYLYVEGRLLPCTDVNLTGFNFSSGKVNVVKNIRAAIPEDVMQELSSKNLAEVFLNAMMTELRTERGAIHLLTNVIDVGESSFDLTETVIGLVVARLYNETDRPAVVCDVEELRQQTTSLLGELFRTIRLPITLADSINCFELSLQALYPFVIVDSGEVYYAHPMVVGFLASQGKLDTLRNDNKATMLGLLKLIEKIHDVKAREMEIYLNPVMDTFRGISKRKSMNELFSIQKRIMLYKYLYRGFNASPSVSTN